MHISKIVIYSVFVICISRQNVCSCFCILLSKFTQNCEIYIFFLLYNAFLARGESHFGATYSQKSHFSGPIKKGVYRLRTIDQEPVCEGSIMWENLTHLMFAKTLQLIEICRHKHGHVPTQKLLMLVAPSSKCEYECVSPLPHNALQVSLGRTLNSYITPDVLISVITKTEAFPSFSSALRSGQV